jgi:arabinofuranan 3-O-arabinosyltransferase
VYPPITGFLLAPFAVVPVEVARVLMLAAGAACVVIALRMLGVRDWRCYGLALVSAPVMGSISIGALSTFLLLGAAAVWRFRDSPNGAGVTTAVTAVSKLFLWPLWVWLLATRRLRTAAVAAGAGAVLVVGGWAAIGFAGLAGYPHLLHVLSASEASQSYSLVGLLGLTGGSALALSVALALGVIAATLAAARGAGGDRRAFGVAIAGALLATPVLWLHYFALLLVPIALYRPRLSALWFAPLAFWLTPFAHSDGSAWKAAFALTAAGAIVLAAVATGTRQRRPPRWGVRTPSLAVRAPE